jgi:hypothetical protein
MDKYSARVEDWREIARALDRLFLLAFISVQIIVTVSVFRSVIFESEE